jgi:uncharacterized protein DUF1569
MKTLARAQDKADVLRRLQGLGVESPRRWGRMSAHQMVCHLSDSFLAVTGQKDVSMAVDVLQRTIVKWIALYVPLRWPSGIRTRPELDQYVGGTKPARFAEDLVRLQQLVEHVTSAEPRWHVHPRFGRMSDAEWLRWAYLHMDHHLRQFGV